MATTLSAAKAAPAAWRRSIGNKALPYLLSLPALLVCIGILVPFGTAVWYSMQRYNLAFPMTRGVIWHENYLDFLSDTSFWNTIRGSLSCTALTVGVETQIGRASCRPRACQYLALMVVAVSLKNKIITQHNNIK